MAQGLRSSSLRRTINLRMRGTRVRVDPDGSVRSLDSLAERRALFGFEQVRLFKVQEGIVVPAPKPDWGARVTPRALQLAGRVFDAVEVRQSIEFFTGKSAGYVRRLKFRNAGQAPIRLRAVDLLDPTAANFSEASGTWGSLGVNAFNRGTHVAIDEVSEPPSARVVGSSPGPSKYFMTTDRSRAQEALASGELREPTSGMSGQVIIVSSHEVELQPGDSRELAFASIYSPQKLEDALSDFARFQSGERSSTTDPVFFACSDPTITETALWAAASLEGGVYAEDRLDKYEALPGLTRVDPAAARSLIEEAKPLVRKDGSLPHAVDATQPGTLETAVFLQGFCSYLLAQDKKVARVFYPTAKKLAGYLLASTKDHSAKPDPSLAQGWRRHLGKGYPSGEIPEVSLAAAGGLLAASRVARLLSKSSEAGRFRERAELLTERVRKKLTDERGFLALCLDPSGRLRTEETVDMAVASYRHPPLRSAGESSAHRLLEKDFDTAYGPRCVPTSNQVYFNRAYGEGQLGGVWTRASLAHAIVCYRAGLSGIGSLALAKVSRLVMEDSVKLGSPPGVFPTWVDVDSGVFHGEETDAPAASRFIEALLEGELGLSADTDKPSVAPPASSTLSWLSASGFWAGEPATVFVGREAGRAHVFFSCGRLESKGGSKFAKSERLDLGARGLHALSFYDPGQVICVGNSTSAQVKRALSFSPRSADFKRLSVSLEEYDPSKGSWAKTGTLRVSTTMAFETTVGANDWKAYRVSSV